MEQVVDDEVASHRAGRVQLFHVAGEEVGDVAALKNEEHQPVDAGDDVVHAEGRVVRIVLGPYLPAIPDAIVGLVEGVVEGDDDGQQPGDCCQDLVSDDGVLAVAIALREWIDYSVY